VPSTREFVVRRWVGVSSSIHPAWTAVADNDANSRGRKGSGSFMVYDIGCIIVALLIRRPAEELQFNRLLLFNNEISRYDTIALSHK